MRGIRAVLTGSVTLAFLFAITFAQNFPYQPEDWIRLPSLAETTSASEGEGGIYFSTLDGLLFFDFFTQSLSPEPELNFALPARRIYQVFQDPSTLSLWIVYQGGVAYRTSTDESWLEISFIALPDNFDGRRVTRIGSNFDGIWIDENGLYTQLNSFTGQFMRRTMQLPATPIDWNISPVEFMMPPDVIGWFTTGDWTSNINEFVGPGGSIIVPTFTFRDREDYVWFATDLGVLFRGDRRTRQLEALQVGIAPKPVITMLQDGNRVWFADNAFRRTGRSAVNKEDYFLTYWDEKASRWKYYNGVESQVIRDVGVNHMLRLEGRLWLATMEGIALLHIRKGAWRWIGRIEGLTDPAIWDLEYHQGVVYAATAAGVERIDPKTLTVLADTTEAYPHSQVLALFSDGGSLFAGTVTGLYEYKAQRDTPWRHISDLPVNNIWSAGGELFIVAAN
ncbi:MAG: hypothetical protein V3W14_08585, partial [Candidatus Neomarinimicrobiota bacterium]